MGRRGRAELDCFNEAPALHGGKYARYGAPAMNDDASMRPPHYTGENVRLQHARYATVLASMRPPHYTGENSGYPFPADALASFNEAPALHGGKLVLYRHQTQRQHRFNEAPALHGGKWRGARLYRLDHLASMRPPHYTGENLGLPVPSIDLRQLQ